MAQGISCPQRKKTDGNVPGVDSVDQIGKRSVPPGGHQDIASAGKLLGALTKLLGGSGVKPVYLRIENLRRFSQGGTLLFGTQAPRDRIGDNGVVHKTGRLILQ